MGCQGDEVDLRAHRESRDHNAAAEQEIVLWTLQLQVNVRRGTHPLRIADANTFAGESQIGIEAAPESQVAGDAQKAATAHRSQRLYFKAILIELESSVQLAQAVRQIFEGKRCICKLHTPRKVRILQWSMRLHSKAGRAARSKVGIDCLGQLEIDCTVGGNVELALLLEAESAPQAHVGFFPGDMQWIEADERIGQGRMYSALAAQMNAVDCGSEFPESCFPAEILGFCQRTLEGHGPGKSRLAGEAVDVRQLKQ